MKKTNITGALVVATGLAVALAARATSALRRIPSATTVDVAAAAPQTKPRGMAERTEELVSRLAGIHGMSLSGEARDEIAAKGASWQRAMVSDLTGWIDRLDARSSNTQPGLADIADYVREGRAAGLSDATLRRRVSSIANAARLIGMDDVFTWSALKDDRTDGPAERTKGSLAHMLIDEAGDGLKGLRDATLVAIGYDADLKSKEIAGIEAKDFFEEGGKVMLRLPASAAARSGREAAEIDGTTVRLMTKWAKEARIGSGPVFRRLVPPNPRPGQPQKTGTEAITGPGATFIIASLYDRATSKGLIDPDKDPGLRARVRNDPLRVALA